VPLIPALAIAAVLAGCSSSATVTEPPDARRVGGWTAAATESTESATTDDRRGDTAAEQTSRDRVVETDWEAVNARDVTSDRRDAMLAAVDSWMGTPYHFGGTTRSGVDCSAFVQSVFRESLNLRLPRTTEAQRSAGTVVDDGDISFGDLVFFQIDRGTAHVGIVVGPGRFAHASSGAGVTVSDLSETYWSRRFDRAVRFDPLLAEVSGGPPSRVASLVRARNRLAPVPVRGNPESVGDRRRGW